MQTLMDPVPEAPSMPLPLAAVLHTEAVAERNAAVSEDPAATPQAAPNGPTSATDLEPSPSQSGSVISSSEGGDDDDDFSSSGSEDDVPLASKANPALLAGDTGRPQHGISKRKADSGSEQEGSGSGTGRRKRQTLFQRVRSTERCGKCRTCLNPHLKKACETIRAQQAAKPRSKAKPTADSSKMHTSETVMSGPSQAASATSISATVSVLAMRDILARIISPHGQGGVTDPKHMPPLESLLAEQTDLGPRSVLLTVLQLSSDEIRSLAVRGKAIKQLEAWFVEAAEGHDSCREPAARARFMCDVIKCLAVLPVDVDALRRTGIGRTFGKLSKSLNKDILAEHTTEVATACKSLVDQWKRLVDPVPSGNAGKTSGADTNGVHKRKESGTSEQQHAAKKSKPLSGSGEGASVVHSDAPQPTSQPQPDTPPATLHSPADAADVEETFTAAGGVPASDAPTGQPSAQVNPSLTSVSDGDGDVFMTDATPTDPIPADNTAAHETATADQPANGSHLNDAARSVDSKPVTEGINAQSVTVVDGTAHVSASTSDKPSGSITAAPIQEASHTVASPAATAPQGSSKDDTVMGSAEVVDVNPADDAGQQTTGATSDAITAALEQPSASSGVSAAQPSAAVIADAPAVQPAVTITAAAAPAGASTEQPAISAPAASAAAPGTAPSAAPAVKPPGRTGVGRTGGLQLSLGRLSAGAGDSSTRLGTLRNGVAVARLGSLRNRQPLTEGMAAVGGIINAAAQIASSEQQAVALFGAAVAAAAANDAAIANTPVVTLPSPKLPAAERAAAAAANADLGLAGEADVQRLGASSAKRKRVHWPADDTKLQSVRWFRKDDPPCKASQDAPLGRTIGPSSLLAGTGLVAGAHAPGFERAARREHARERAALAAQHEHEERERGEMLNRLKDMHATTPWSTPPLLVLDAEWRLAAGEESSERHELAIKSQTRPPVSYPTQQHVPPTPTEPPINNEPQPHMSAIPRIPLQAANAHATGTGQVSTSGAPAPGPAGVALLQGGLLGVPGTTVGAGPSTTFIQATSTPAGVPQAPLPSVAELGALALRLQQQGGQQPAGQLGAQPLVLLAPHQPTITTGATGITGVVPAPASADGAPNSMLAVLSSFLSGAGGAMGLAGTTASQPAPQQQPQATPAPSEGSLSALLNALAKTLPTNGAQPAAGAAPVNRHPGLAPQSQNPLLPSNLLPQSQPGLHQHPTHVPLLPQQASVGLRGPPPQNLTPPTGHGPPPPQRLYPGPGPGPARPPYPAQSGPHDATRGSGWDKGHGHQGAPGHAAAPPGGLPHPSGGHMEGSAQGALGRQSGFSSGPPPPGHHNTPAPPGRGHGYAGGGRGGRGGDGGGGGRGQRVCAFFNTAQGCKKGDTCAFLHVVRSGGDGDDEGMGGAGRGGRGGGRGGRGRGGGGPGERPSSR